MTPVAEQQVHREMAPHPAWVELDHGLRAHWIEAPGLQHLVMKHGDGQPLAPRRLGLNQPAGYQYGMDAFITRIRVTTGQNDLH